MAYNRENYIKLKREYEDKNLAAKRLADARMLEVGMAHPDIAEIDRELSMTGIKILGTAATLVITFFGMSLFKFTDVVAFGQTVFNIVIPFKAGFIDTATTLLIKNNVFFLTIARLACTPIVPFIGKLCQKTKITALAHTAISSVMPVILIAISAIALAGDSYNPFLYFQF